MDRLTAIKELLDRCVRRPNYQYAYSRCEVCDTAFWDREEHRFGCKLLEWREALRDQSLSQEAVREEALEMPEDAETLEWEFEFSDTRRQVIRRVVWREDYDKLRGFTIRALKREPNAAGGNDGQ